MNKVFLFGWFGSDNVGDDALLNQTFDIIKSIDDKSQITVLNNSIDCKNKDGYNNIVFKKKSLKNLFVQIFKNNLFIFGPGGLFPNKNFKKILLIYFYVLLLKIFRKKVIFIGLGIENCNFDSKYSRFFIKHTMNLIDDCTLRYDYTIYENQKNILKKCQISSDVMFCNEYKTNFKKTKDKYVVFALANIFENNEYKENFIKCISELVRRVISDGYKIHFLTFTDGKDFSLNQEIINNIDESNINCINYKYTTNLEFYYNEIKNSEFLIGMRFHSIVFALNLYKKLLAISYSSKIDELLYDFKLNENSIKICVSKDKYFCEIINLNEKKLNNIYKNVKKETKFEKLIAESLIIEKDKASNHIKTLKKYLIK